jgi:hypothetical protein
MKSIRSGASIIFSVVSHMIRILYVYRLREVFFYDSGEEQTAKYSGYEFDAVIPKPSEDY